MSKNKEIKIISSDEDFQALEKKQREDYFNRNSLKENILALASGKPVRDDNPLKSLTVRLTPADYARLSVLSSRLNQSPSGLAKIILLAGLSDSIAAYLSVAQVDNPSADEDFSLDSQEREIAIIEDFL